MGFGEICLRDTAGSFEWARWLHLARSGSQSQRPIWFFLPARGASHIIKQNKVITCYLRNFLKTFFQRLLNLFTRFFRILGRDGSLNVNFGVNRTSVAISDSALTRSLVKVRVNLN